jgi:hypothetical protein
MELNGGRRNNGFGPEPLSYNEIGEWSRLLNIDIDRWEVQVLKQMDVIFLRVYGEKTK